MNAETTVRADRPHGPNGAATPLIDELVTLSVAGLTRMHNQGDPAFPHTSRRDPDDPRGLHLTGSSPRYTAIAALGISLLDADAQREILHGETAADLAWTLGQRPFDPADPGASALEVWAAAEIADCAPPAKVESLAAAATLSAGAKTVDLAWALTALLATGAADAAARLVAERLMAAQGDGGLFPHTVPAAQQPWYRAHVGCFADQVYPIQALVRFHLASGDARALVAANSCADRVVELQGAAGQWWWHYDARSAAVVEQYPVYSVHQHAMAPLALLELARAGGHDHRAAVIAGLRWLSDRPETDAELVDGARGVVWRKVRRREPRKAVRSLRSVVSARFPAARLRWLDRVFVPGPVDEECRPYELAWLLYAWLRDAPSTWLSSHHPDALEGR